MAEILLPTAEKQDEIKKDTTEILKQFPISGGTDFLDMKAIVSRVYSPNDKAEIGGKKSIMKVSGKGIITDSHIKFWTESNMHSITLNVDGVDIDLGIERSDGIVYETHLFSESVGTSWYLLRVPHLIPFNKSFEFFMKKAPNSQFSYYFSCDGAVSYIV